MNQFDDIRPYRDEEVRSTIDRLLNDNEFIAAVTRFRFPTYPKWLLILLKPIVRHVVKKQSKDIHSIHDLQLLIERYVSRMIRETTSEVTISGDENIDKNKKNLFISNHRDIALDPALVNWSLHHNGHTTLQIAIGDNLLTKAYVSDLMRLNKSFIVNRSAKKPREKFKAAKYLSEYIYHVIAEEKENVWIAQREGRAKDGIDVTNSAVVGMLALNKPKTMALSDYIKELNIIPVSISYEKDPCDMSKAGELYALKTQGAYEKQDHEDAKSIAKGITGQKGRVHIAFGEPLLADYSDTDEIVDDLNRAIITNYVLQPSNCIAYQELHGQLPDGLEVTSQKLPFTEREFLKETQQFHQRIQNCDAAYRDTLLAMYANPIVSKLSLHS